MLKGIIIKEYKKRAFARNDGNPAVTYFTNEDFPPMKKEEASFRNKKGALLKGAFYYNEAKSTERIVLLEHGMGAGHRAYMSEINMLTSHGYTVFSYDHYGCGDSEGEGVNGFGGSLPDLACAVSFLKKSGYPAKGISVIGHSWGGYSTLNLPAFHGDISACVAISGFISVESIINQFLTGIARCARKSVLAIERNANPETYELDARKTLKSTEVRMLIIHAENDPLVSYKNNFEALRSALVDNDNVSYIRLTDRFHNPNYTKEAVALLNAMGTELKKSASKLKTTEKIDAFKAKWDFKAMSEQDETVWSSIFDHIESASSSPAESAEQTELAELSEQDSSASEQV